MDKELENANSGNISLSLSATIVILSKKLYFLFLLTNKKNDGDAIAPVFVNAVAKNVAVARDAKAKSRVSIGKKFNHRRQLA